MRKINKVLSTCLSLLVVFSFIQCSIKTSSECKSKKIQLLLEDIFQKKEYYYILGNVKPIDSSIKYNEPIDSSKYFIFLHSSNLRIPDKEFYLHLNKEFEPTFPDSVKLREVKDPTMAYKHNFKVDIELIEVNEDTTKLKVSIGWLWNIFLEEVTFFYSFDEKNCKWSVLDSTIWRY